MEHSNSLPNNCISLDQLPREKWWGGSNIDDLYQFEGFWYRAHVLSAAISAKSHFMARDDDDVILASSIPRQEQPGMSTPRLFRTHVPYTMLPDSVKNSRCKIVYITRNPKDTFVSLWLFLNKFAVQQQKPPCPFDLAFDSFIKGVHSFGPFHDHILKVKSGNFASFLGKNLLRDEDLDKILWRCSLERLKNLEINKYGKNQFTGVANEAYFRRGTVGDWKNHISVEMEEKLDKITHIKFQGSGLDLC
ncbi:hypothetical protein ACFE04_007376 [Oxalis oulophora]